MRECSDRCYRWSP
jgi:hypothetical protein